MAGEIKKPMSSEEFARMAEGSIKSEGEAAHHAEQQAQNTQNAASATANEDAAPIMPQSTAASARSESSEQSSTFNHETQGNQNTTQPDVYGHKINTNVLVAKENLRPNLSQRAASLENQTSGRIFTPKALPPPPTTKDMKILLRDPVFENGPLRGTTLHQAIQERALDQPIRESVARGDVHAEVMKRSDILQLFSMRNNLDKKDEAKILVRYQLAKLIQEKQQRVQALHYQNESNTKKDEDVRTGRSLAKHSDAARDELARKYRNANAESPFEEALQKFLADNKSIPDLMNELRAQFPQKSDAEWETFFKNALTQNSAELETKKTTADLMQALFRGVFKKGSNGELMMVSDLSFANGDDKSLFKFSQIALKDSKLLDILRQLKPGDLLSPEVLKLLGDEIVFLQLAHVIADSNLSAEQQAAILRSYRQQVSSSSQRGLEDALADERKRKSRAQEEMAAQQGAQFAGLPHKDIQPRPGRQKLRMYLLYTVLGATGVLILFILLRSFL